jgi:hypothetical protein
VKQGYFADQASAMQADDQRLEQAGQPAWWASQPPPLPLPDLDQQRDSNPNAGKAWSASDDARLRASWHDPAHPTAPASPKPWAAAAPPSSPGWCVSANIPTAMRYGRRIGRGGGMMKLLMSVDRFRTLHEKSRNPFIVAAFNSTADAQ